MLLSAESTYIILFAGRVCPCDVSTQYMAASSQVIAKWHFDESLLEQISEFRVYLASSDAQDDITGTFPIAGRDVEATNCFEFTMTNVTSNKTYMPSVTAIYQDNIESKTEGRPFETNGMKSNQFLNIYCK